MNVSYPEMLASAVDPNPPFAEIVDYSSIHLLSIKIRECLVIHTFCSLPVVLIIISANKNNDLATTI